jgi:hypothetical protein
MLSIQGFGGQERASVKKERGEKLKYGLAHHSFLEGRRR